MMKLVGEGHRDRRPYGEWGSAEKFRESRINLNTLKTLPTGCWVLRKNGLKSWVMFRYEKLQGFCYACGVIRHEQKDCREAVKMIAISKEIPLYGAKLSVPSAKPLSLLIK